MRSMSGEGAAAETFTRYDSRHSELSCVAEELYDCRFLHDCFAP